MKKLSEFSADKERWITFVEGDFYPDALPKAAEIYKPVLERFGEVVAASSDSCNLLERITEIRGTKMRTQLCRVFRRYVSPDTSVEMLKVKSQVPNICANFGERFRPLADVRKSLALRPTPDDALIAILNEYKDRGKKGYTLTGDFFEWFETKFETQFLAEGPKGAGRDINLANILHDYPKDTRPVDIAIRDKASKELLVVGLARYDSDRGGAQEDDRISGYRNVVTELMGYADGKNLRRLKLLFLNDGPGLLLGSMWRDYCGIEAMREGRVMVTTVKMLNERLTAEWIRS